MMVLESPRTQRPPVLARWTGEAQDRGSACWLASHTPRALWVGRILHGLHIRKAEAYEQHHGECFLCPETLPGMYQLLTRLILSTLSEKDTITFYFKHKWEKTETQSAHVTSWCMVASHLEPRTPTPGHRPITIHCLCGLIERCWVTVARSST